MVPFIQHTANVPPNEDALIGILHIPAQSYTRVASNVGLPLLAGRCLRH